MIENFPRATTKVIAVVLLPGRQEVSEVKYKNFAKTIANINLFSEAFTVNYAASAFNSRILSETSLEGVLTRPSQSNRVTPFLSLDISMVGDNVDYDGIECNHGEATLEEVTGDEVKKDIGPGDVTEHSQAECCFRLNPLASHGMETFPGEDETEYSGSQHRRYQQ